MMWEPERLDEATIAGLRLEEELRTGQRVLPGTLIDVGLENIVRPLSLRVDNILALPKRRVKAGLVVLPLLTPGPHDVSFVLAEREGRLREVLEDLGHWNMPTGVLVLAGALASHSVVTVDGFRFAHYQRIVASHLSVIPSREKRDIVVERDSILLLASAGQVRSSQEHYAQLDFGEYCGHLRLDATAATTTTWRRQRYQDSFGNSVSFSQHPAGSELCATGGALSLAVHMDGEPLEVEHSPDLLLIAPNIAQATPSTQWSMDVVMS